MDPRQGHTPAPIYIPYYNRAAVLTYIASGAAVVSGYRCRASGRVCVLQRGAGGVISTFAGLVFVAVECGKSQKKPL